MNAVLFLQLQKYKDSLFMDVTSSDMCSYFQFYILNIFC